MLNLAHARTFLAVLDENGFRAAARRLRLSPSTILEHVRQLEAELTAQLLTRGADSVAPTPQGAAFAPLARALVDTAARARDVITTTPLRIAAATNVGTYLLQSMLASFQTADPCRIELWIGANPDVGQRLAAGRTDVALMEWWDGRAGFTATTWRREPLVVIVSPGHPWATRREIAARELVGMPILGGEPGTGTGSLLREALRPLSGQLTTIGGFGSTEAVKRAVRAGRGISLVIASAVADEVETGRLIALRVADADLAKDMKLILPKGTPTGTPAARFAAFASNVRLEGNGAQGRI